MKFVNKLIKEPGSEPLLTPLQSFLLRLPFLNIFAGLIVSIATHEQKAKESYEAEDYGEWGDADKEEFKRLMDAKRQNTP